MQIQNLSLLVTLMLVRWCSHFSHDVHLDNPFIKESRDRGPDSVKDQII